MPRGVYQRKNSRKNVLQDAMIAQAQAPVIQETDEEIEARIAERFDVLEQMVNLAISGEARAVIGSGPGGLGKSYTTEKLLNDWDPDGLKHVVIKGYVRPTGLYKTLWEYRSRGQVIVFDDADSIFNDDVSLNMLKAVCDTNGKRRVSYLAETNMTDEAGDLMPRSFEFEGSIIFLSNIDFDSWIDRGHKLAPHLEAMMSRAHYVDLAMKSRRDYVIRIKQVAREGLLSDVGLTSNEADDVLNFIDRHQDKMRKLSLREALKIATYRKRGGNWAATARVVTCK
jgi:hypothetical protein